MANYIHELITHAAKRSPGAIALKHKDTSLTYTQLDKRLIQVAKSFESLQLSQGDRVGVYLAKNIEAVQSMFATSVVGSVFVPINPVLKAPQVEYIVNDCQISLLITNTARLKALLPTLDKLSSLTTIIVIDAEKQTLAQLHTHKRLALLTWQEFLTNGQQISQLSSQPITENHLAAILYTSGSTGQPKGIMLSHQNIVLGAQSVSEYLHQTADDIILAVLPLSFDYGLNQLTSAFLVGAQCVLLDYLLPNDVTKAITKYKVTGLAAVPPLWNQLVKAKWANDAGHSMRYFTNSGGVLPLPTLASLQEKMPHAKPFLMYGLTEAFRSTYLPPEDLHLRPNSMGKAIQNAEILVVREDGSECDSDEVGELVHVGPLVTLGYWQNDTATKDRFKKTPAHAINTQKTELAVFSGDFVKKDKEGFLYFVARKDNMIKTSGYRVSPTEVEATLQQLDGIDEVAVIGKSSEQLGQEILALVVTSLTDQGLLKKNIVKHCQLNLPSYMMPKQVLFLKELPRNANNKIDTKLLISTYNA